jgi:protein-S-isoprenylcysteine O-methyltransferase Ste14
LSSGTFFTDSGNPIGMGGLVNSTADPRATAGGVLRIWPVFVLGRRFSGLVAIQPEHTLATSGVYGNIRHPSYLGLLINSLGRALAFPLQGFLESVCSSFMTVRAPECARVCPRWAQSQFEGNSLQLFERNGGLGRD